MHLETQEPERNALFVMNPKIVNLVTSYFVTNPGIEIVLLLSDDQMIEVAAVDGKVALVTAVTPVSSNFARRAIDGYRQSGRAAEAFRLVGADTDVPDLARLH